MTLPGVVRGDVVIDLPDIIVLVPDNSTVVNGFFEITLSLIDPDLTTPPLVGTFNVQIMGSGSDLTFTAATSTSDATPLFPSPLAIDNASGLLVQAADDIDSDVPAFNGAGLVRVSFTIAAGNIGNTFSLSLTPVITRLTNSTGSTIYPLTLQGGSITVAAVPEAAHLITAAMGVAICGSTAVSYIRRRRRQEIAG